MYKADKINKKPLALRVEDSLMELIQKTPIGIGEKIPNEYELAELFGVGRSTIRETVKSLTTQGVLEVRRGSGTYVVRTSKIDDDPIGLSSIEDKYEMALDLFNLRLMLEPEIAALASDNATEEEKEELKRLCDETEEIYRSGKDHTQKDIEFHTCIARCSKNRVVELLQPVIQTAVATFVKLTYSSLKEETIETHKQITEAIIKGDSVGAKCAMIMHLTYTRQMLLKLKDNK